MRSPWIPTLISLLALACAAGPSARNGSPAEQVARLEQTRSLGEGALERLALQSGAPKLQARALLALARIQALSTVPTVIRALADPQPSVRGEAAFAAGELAQAWEEVPSTLKDSLTQAVVATESRETDGPARLLELEALGKLGTPAALEALSAKLEATDPEVVGRAATSLGVAGRQKHPLPTSAWARLEAALPLATFPVTYAWANAHAPRARPLLQARVRDVDSQVRALAVKGLAALEGDEDVPLLTQALKDEDGRVAAEAVRGLVEAVGRCKPDATCAAADALGALVEAPKRLRAGHPSRGSLPLLAFAQAPLPDGLRGLAVSLRRAIDEAAFGAGPGSAEAAPADATPTESLRRDLGRLDCRMAAAIDRIDGRLAAVKTCGLDAVPEPRRLALGLSALPEGPHFAERASLPQLLEALQHPDASVRLAAVNALGQTHSPKAAEALRPLLASEDLVLAADAAAALGELGDQAAIPALLPLFDRIREKLPEEAAPLAQAAIALEAKEAIPALTRWLHAPHSNLRLQAAAALTALQGAPVEVPVVPQPLPDVARLPVPPMGTRLLVQTERGPFELRLRPDLAPVTSANFAALAQKGFFQDLTFHRIVPDFVVQGGDPRGDGEGGPGYTIPCEVNTLRYARGVVGVALSGKDTGGSQLFVATSPQPHLDGRYTAFAQVTSGMAVVDALLEGDRILSVKVLRP